MSWLYLPAEGADYWQASGFTDGERSAMLRTKSTPSGNSSSESQTDSLMTPQSGTTCEPSTGDPGEGKSMSFRQAFLASRSQSRDSSEGAMTSGTGGPIPSALLEKSVPPFASWKTYRGYSQPVSTSVASAGGDSSSRLKVTTTSTSIAKDAGKRWLLPQKTLFGTSQPFSGTWPKAGMMLGGECYQRQSWERRISEIGSGLWRSPQAANATQGPKSQELYEICLNTGKSQITLTDQVAASMWPTPSARDWKNGNHSENTWEKNSRPLNEAVLRWPTPQAADANRKGADYARANRPNSGGDDLNTAVARTGLPGGQLNPRWVEWLMATPIGWTSLKPLETHKFQSWLRQHGIYFQGDSSEQESE